MKLIKPQITTNIITSIAPLLVDQFYLEHIIQACAPSFCTYNTIERMHLSNAMTLFISLYGGLIIILRLRNHLRNMNGNIEATERTENDIRQQRITKLVCLILLCGITLFLNVTWMNVEHFDFTFYYYRAAPCPIEFLPITESTALECYQTQSLVAADFNSDGTFNEPTNVVIGTSILQHSIIVSDFN
ncbi:hypothetical protein I4U23_012229 [Adineta vaga]|nr:hypothetical protein I4U23_012229 [Adineta vaga]